MKYIALDVETANADMASICSIGVACFDGGEVVDEWYTLVDPEDYFDGINISIHGIDEKAVVGAPNYAKVGTELQRRLAGSTVVTHTHFDRVALHQASSRCAHPALPCIWLDSSRVVRRTWADCSKKGYGLADVCRRIGYEFDHHNALEDAKAAGHVLWAAIQESGIGLDEWLARVNQPIDPASSNSGAAVRRQGAPQGPLAGEVLVFTGSLQIPRSQAADLAASVGCEVGAGVTKKTTMLVVGDIDVQRTLGHEKSSKHRKAEDLIAKGSRLRIIRETDFHELVSLAH